MERATPLVAGETYHVYNRGAHKQDIFIGPSDYRRFSLLLYLCNSTESIHFSNITKKYGGESLIQVFEEVERPSTLVDVFAYCLMPNHFHLVVRPKTDTGLSVFMKKLLTAYAMYFNLKYDHSGVLFQGPFKSKHLHTEAYFRYIFAYVHLNPLDLFAPGWETKGVDVRKVRRPLKEYWYSSYYDYNVGDRLEKRILSLDDIPEFLQTDDDIEDLLRLYQGESSIFKEGVY